MQGGVTQKTGQHKKTYRIYIVSFNSSSNTTKLIAVPELVIFTVPDMLFMLADTAVEYWPVLIIIFTTSLVHGKCPQCHRAWSEDLHL